MSDEKNTILADLSEERLRLEREALAVERERLATARAHTEEMARLARPGRPGIWLILGFLAAALAFAGGFLTGQTVSDRRRQLAQQQNLEYILSHVDDKSVLNATNAPAATNPEAAAAAHGNVKVVVIQ